MTKRIAILSATVVIILGLAAAPALAMEGTCTGKLCKTPAMEKAGCMATGLAKACERTCDM